MAPRGRYEVICVSIIVFSFGRTSSCSHLYPKRQMGWAQFDRGGVTWSKVRARSVQCVAGGKPSTRVWPSAYLRQIPGCPQHPRGWCFGTHPGVWFPRPPWRLNFPHLLSPCTQVRFRGEPSFIPIREYTSFRSCCTEQHVAILRASSSPAP